MLDPIDQSNLHFLHENDASGTSAKHGHADEDTDLLIYHLRECKNVAVERARKTFDGYLSELEVAFNLDITNASSKQHKVESVVEKVLNEIKQDVRDMTDTLVELTNFTRNVTLRQDALKKRAHTAEQGQRRLRAAKVRVYEHVMQRTLNKELPSAVLLFLFQPWSDYMCYTALRFGDNSPAWSQAVAIMDNIIWAIKPKQSATEQAQLTELREPLLQRISEGFRTIRYDATKSANMLSSLRQLLDHAGQQVQALHAGATLSEALQKNAEKKAYQYVPPKDYTEVMEREMVERLRKIEFGTVFQFGDNKRFRLAWFNARTSHYMMVDEVSQSAEMMTGVDIARALLYKKAVILPRAGHKKPVKAPASKQP